MAKLRSHLLFGYLVPVSKKLLSNRATREFFSEMTGTFILVVSGLSAHVVYKARKQEMDTFAAAFCFGVGALIAISATLDVSGAHLNPAVTTAMASIGRLSWKRVPHYMAAQYIGAFFSAFVTWLINQDAISTFDPGYTEHGSAVYVTSPGEGVGLFSAFLDQILSTGILAFSILAADGPKLPRSVHPIYFTLVITGIVISFNYNAGAVLNPARDLGPRLFTWIFGYGSDVFMDLSGCHWWLVAIIAPHLGALLGVWYYILLIDPSVAYENESDSSTKISDSFVPTNFQVMAPKNQENHEAAKLDHIEKSNDAKDKSDDYRF